MQALTHSRTLLASVRRLANDKTLVDGGYDNDTQRPCFSGTKNQQFVFTVSTRGVVWKHIPKNKQAVKVGRLSLTSNYIIIKG